MDHKEIEDFMNIELNQIVDGPQETPKEDGLVALRQLPAPLFALDTLKAILTIMARSVPDLEISMVRIFSIYVYEEMARKINDHDSGLF